MNAIDNRVVGNCEGQCGQKCGGEWLPCLDAHHPRVYWSLIGERWLNFLNQGYT